MPSLTFSTAAALKIYRRLLLAPPGSAAEMVLTDQLAHHVHRIPEGEMTEYARRVVETINRLRHE